MVTSKVKCFRGRSIGEQVAFNKGRQDSRDFRNRIKKRQAKISKRLNQLQEPAFEWDFNK